MDVYTLLYGEFFYCKECDFEFSKLGQASYTIEGCCSSCGSDDIDYLPVSYIKNHIDRIKNELEAL